MSERDMILIRGRVVEAERIYASGRGDYTVYRYRGRIYVVKHGSKP